jgi:hypothetical protein
MPIHRPVLFEWLPLATARDWLERRRIAPPPSWRAVPSASSMLAAPETAIARCLAWLHGRDGLKREALWRDARDALPGLSTRDFDAAYRLAFRRRRGRPRKSPN